MYSKALSFNRGLFTTCVLLLQSLCACGQDPFRNLPEYSLPLTAKKLVIAHCMTNIIRFKGHILEDVANPAYYPRTGNITAPIGGMNQAKPMEDSLLANATLDEAVEFEMRAAIRSGIDGFQFYYVLGASKWDDIIKAYFRVATQKHIDFKFTFCISHPKGRTEGDKIAEFAPRINGIMDEVGRQNPHWLRTPDGRLIVYQWLGEPLADIPADKQSLPDAYYVARAYKRLADAVHEHFACIFTINEEISLKKLDEYLDYFPATWIWTLPYSKDYIGYMVAEACRKKHRTLTGSVFCDFYTSKLQRRGTWDMYHSAEEAVVAGIDNADRKYITCGLSYNFRKLWEFNLSNDVSITNVITWNDYPEGHHLAPEINHNEGFSILQNWYKAKWKNHPSPYAGGDVAVVFFKKYEHNIKPSPYDIPVVAFQKEVVPAVWEDSIEVVTMLKASGRLNVNGRLREVPSGFAVTKVPMSTGPVTVSMLRNNLQVLHFVTPEGITDKPYRADRLTYSYSSQFDSFYKDIFPGFKPQYSHEYNSQWKN